MRTRFGGFRARRLQAAGVFRVLCVVFLLGFAAGAPAAQRGPDLSYYGYATYLGSTADDVVRAMTVDSAGRIILVGNSSGTDFPSAARTATIGPANGTAPTFVLRLSKRGSKIDFIVRIGGSGTDEVNDVTIDGSGRIVIVGTTNSTDFPMRNASQPTIGGGTDAFVARIDPGTLELVDSTLLGGNGDDFATSVGIRSDDAIIVGGRVRQGAQVTVLDRNGTAIVSSFVLSEGDYAYVTDLVVDRADVIYAVSLSGILNRIDVETGVVTGVSTRVEGHAVALDENSRPVVAGVRENPSSGYDTNLVVIVDPQFPFPAREFEYVGVSTKYVNVKGLGVDPGGNISLFWTYVGELESRGGLYWRIAPTGRVTYSAWFDYWSSGFHLSESGQAWASSATQLSGLPTVRPIQTGIRGARDLYVARFDLPVHPGPAPTIASVRRVPIPATVSFKLEIDGSGFHPGARVFVDDELLPTYGAKVKSSTLIKNLPDLLRNGPRQITVVNPDGASATILASP